MANNYPTLQDIDLVEQWGRGRVSMVESKEPYGFFLVLNEGKSDLKFFLDERSLEDLKGKSLEGVMDTLSALQIEIGFALRETGISPREVYRAINDYLQNMEKDYQRFLEEEGLSR